MAYSFWSQPPKAPAPAVAYLIDPETRTIEPFEYQPMVGFPGLFKSGLCLGWTYTSGDVLYVDDECLLRKAPECGGFVAQARPDRQPLFDKAVLVGAEFQTKQGWSTRPPWMTIERARAEFRFLDRVEALAWFHDRAAEPAVKVNGEIVAPWADILKDLEGEPGSYQPSWAAQRF